MNDHYTTKMYNAKRILFWHLVNINKEDHKRKMSMKIHELKWRNVNAEIICRPNTGQEWHNYSLIIDYVNSS